VQYVRDVSRLRGCSNAEIGQPLFISEGTVKTHVTHGLPKLGLRDRVQAAVPVHRSGLFDD
jgi:DNA-binding NarL/FixJ family response regulator